MAGIPLVQTQDSNVNQLQQNITQQVNPILANPITGGRFLFAYKLNSGANLVNHGLGKAISGYIICSTSAAISVSDNLQSNASPKVSFTLNSSAASTVNLYCF